MTVSTTTEAHRDARLCAVRERGIQLVRVRCKEQLIMEELGRAIRTSIRGGASIDSISEASGLKPETVKDFAQSHDFDENLAVLSDIG